MPRRQSPDAAPIAVDAAAAASAARRRAASLALGVVLAASLAACAEAPRIPPAEPAPSASPLFSSDAEALEAATEAYEEYLRVSNGVTADGAVDPSPLEVLATPDLYEQELLAFQFLTENDFRTSGGTEIEGTVFQQRFVDENGITSIAFYACLDLSNIRVVDSEGADVTPSSRGDAARLLVEFQTQSADDPSLVLSSSEVWDGELQCDG